MAGLCKKLFMSFWIFITVVIKIWIPCVVGIVKWKFLIKNLIHL